MRKTLYSCTISLKDAFTWEPSLFIVNVVVRLLCAILPASQVVVINQLVTRVTGKTHYIPFLILATVVIGLMLPLEAILGGIQQRLQLKLKCQYLTRLTDEAARLSPQQRSDEDISNQLQGAVMAAPFNLAWQTTSTMSVIQAVITSLFLTVSLWSINPMTAVLVLFSLLPPVIGYMMVASAENNYWPLISKAGRRHDYLSNLLFLERPGNELTALNAAHTIGDFANSEEKQIRDSWLRVNNTRIVTSVVSATVTIILLGAAFFFLITGDDLLAAQLVASIMGIVSGMLATADAGKATGELIASTPVVNSYHRVIAQLHRSETNMATHQTSHNKGLFCSNVSYSYLENRPVLSDFSVSVSKGELVALVGANGSGKTTAVSILTGSLKPDSGEVQVPLATDLSAMWQDSHKYELTVRQFITLGDGDQQCRGDRQGNDGQDCDDLLWHALERACARSFVENLPNGLDTQLGTQWGGVDLSGGEWQRLCLARVWFEDQPIWVLDEPTSALDAQTESIILDHLQEEKIRRAILFISHRAWTLTHIDKIVVLRDGRIVEQGSFNELINQNGPFKSHFESQLW